MINEIRYIFKEKVHLKSEKIIFLDMKIRRMDDSTEYVKVEEEEIDTDICIQILILRFYLIIF